MRGAAKWLLLPLLLAGCVATQEEPPSKAAEAYVKQLNQKLAPGTKLQEAIATVETDGRRPGASCSWRTTTRS
jgi:hypothetical protein